MLMQDVIATMKTEIHRMELRKAELSRAKKQLITELEKSIDKRDTISVRGRANQISSKKSGRLTENELNRKQAELTQSITDTEAECSATDERIKALDSERMSLAEQMQDVAAQCLDLRQADIRMREDLKQLAIEKQAKDLQLLTLMTASSVMDGATSDNGACLNASTPDVQAVEVEYTSIRSLIEHLYAQHGPNVKELEAVQMLTTAVDVL
jgi:chromosome segregation ATPase